MVADARSAARAVIKDQGVEALTLAEVARRVGVTPAALYRHFEDPPLADIVRQAAREVTAEITDLLQTTVDAQEENDYAARLVEPARAFRLWALANRQEFALLFGTPTAAAGSAQVDVTSDWVRRLAGVWGPEFVKLWAARPYPILDDDELDARLRPQLAEYRRATGVEIPLGALVVMLSCWRSIYGAVALEVFDQFAPLITDHEPMFELLMQDLMTVLGLVADYHPPTVVRLAGAG
ncbi:TetR/AcrR family transcriptional regulator [Micromonospora musae]|uniref:TetR/AcrR family transcriptional regulator n=2 Tax=Micromonospora musae TaxID=1894970 RepID=A0A3A9YHY9_9ACTN|nr:TetR/AcrR family transcriptional regulator [Micromonospora musae]RKN23859.1 TetR/AcrR family transcriptional regulator [Micromonospora musae]RKN31826.1 TetR/AcrR family transcriptional regulator [Micromonospora musae]